MEIRLISKFISAFNIHFRFAPDGTNLETNYYIVNATADTFQLSLTSGGAPLAMANNRLIYLK